MLAAAGYTGFSLRRRPARCQEMLSRDTSQSMRMVRALRGGTACQVRISGINHSATGDEDETGPSTRVSCMSATRESHRDAEFGHPTVVIAAAGDITICGAENRMVRSKVLSSSVIAFSEVSGVLLVEQRFEPYIAALLCRRGTFASPTAFTFKLVSLWCPLRRIDRSLLLRLAVRRGQRALRRSHR